MHVIQSTRVALDCQTLCGGPLYIGARIRIFIPADGTMMVPADTVAIVRHLRRHPALGRQAARILSEADSG